MMTATMILAIFMALTSNAIFSDALPHRYAAQKVRGPQNNGQADQVITDLMDKGSAQKPVNNDFEQRPTQYTGSKGGEGPSQHQENRGRQGQGQDIENDDFNQEPSQELGNNGYDQGQSQYSGNNGYNRGSPKYSGNNGYNRGPNQYPGNNGYNQGWDQNQWNYGFNQGPSFPPYGGFPNYGYQSGSNGGYLNYGQPPNRGFSGNVPKESEHHGMKQTRNFEFKENINENHIAKFGIAGQHIGAAKIDRQTTQQGKSTRITTREQFQVDDSRR